jgi:hypothetical protein
MTHPIPADALSAWHGFMESMKRAEDMVASRAASVDATLDGLRYIALVGAGAIERALDPQLKTQGGFYYSQSRVAAANPDYVMGQAVIDPQRRYRITGQVNGAARLGFGLYTPGADAALRLDAYTSTNRIEIDDDGRFEVTIGPTGGGISHLETKPETKLAFVRQLYLRPDDARAEVTLEALDPGPPVAQPSLNDSFANATRQFDAIMRRFMHWTDTMYQSRNKMVQMPPELDDVVQGDPDTHYACGSFDLQPGEALQIDIVPGPCDYWMISAQDQWLVPIRGCHFNNATARLRADGSARFILAPRGSGDNRLVTQGRMHGTLFARVVNAAERSIPRLTVIRDDAE